MVSQLVFLLGAKFRYLLAKQLGAFMNDSEKGTTVLEYVLFGMFSLVPLAGLLVALLAMVLGVSRFRRGGWKLLLIGIAGILSSHFFTPLINSKLTARDLHRCLTAIEFYKQVHGQYPKELKDLYESKKV
jgi:hypothetical protein